RERPADEEQPVRLGEREHAAVDPRRERAELARAGAVGCEVRAPHGPAAWVRELCEVPGDVQPPPGAEQVVDTAGLLVARAPVGGGHLPAAHRPLGDVGADGRRRRRRVPGEQYEGGDQGGGAATAAVAKWRYGDSFQVGSSREDTHRRRRGRRAYEISKQTSHTADCLTPAARHRTLAPWSQAPTAGSRRRLAGCDGRSEAGSRPTPPTSGSPGAS